MNNLQKDEINSAEKEIEDFIQRNYSVAVVYSSQLSTVLRQLAFAEGALFWFCKIQFSLSIIPIAIGWAFLLFFFACDAIQYFLGYQYFRIQADKFLADFKNEIYDVNHYYMNQSSPQKLHYFFYLKIGMITCSSLILIFSFLIGIYCNH